MTSSQSSLSPSSSSSSSGVLTGLRLISANSAFLASAILASAIKSSEFGRTAKVIGDEDEVQLCGEERFRRLWRFSVLSLLMGEWSIATPPSEVLEGVARLLSDECGGESVTENFLLNNSSKRRFFTSLFEEGVAVPSEL